MDKRVNQFLNDYNLTQYRNNFLHFDFETFINLDPIVLSKIVPSKSDSAKLRKALLSFINESDEIDSVYVKVENSSKLDDKLYEIDYGEAILPDCLEIIPIPKRKSVDLIQSEHPQVTITKMPRIGKAESLLNTEIIQEPEDIETINVISDSDDHEDEIEFHNVGYSEEGSNDVMIVSKDKRNSKSRVAKTARNRDVNKIIRKLRLRDIQDLDMNILFAIYSTKKELNNRERVLLSEIVIKKILIVDTTFVLGKHEFHNIANVIVTAFPGEPIEEYFRNVKHFNDSDIAADRGSLYTAFKKYQAILGSAGIPISKPQVCKKLILAEELELEIKTVSNDVNKSNDELEKEFIASRNHRLKFITDQQSKGMFSTVNYMRKYKILQTMRGYELLLKDAHQIYPSLKGFVPNFGKIAHNIIAYAQSLTWDIEYVSKLLECALETISENNEKLLAILLLPYVLPKAAIKRGEKFIVKSHVATAVQFVRLYESEADETQLFQQLYQEDSKFISGFLDVNLKVFGQFPNINCTILRVGPTTYKFCDPLYAMEVYFKIFLGLNIAYPVYAQHVFDFFGWIAFDLRRPTSSYDVYVSALSYYNMFTADTD